MNLLDIATTSLNSNLHSYMCNERWIFHGDSSVFGQIEKI